ncbi:MAG: glycosyltransferase family 2 protein [Bacteroidota bacterium]
MNVAVVIPSYNAAVSLPELLERTLAVISKEKIIVVNDGSTDQTRETAGRIGVKVISHEHNKGKGAALQTGFQYVLQNDFDAVITMDADLQHQPEEIPNFISCHSKGNRDIIIGNRLHNTAGMPVHRLLSNTLTTAMVRLRTGAIIKDSQSGFRFITRRVLEKISVRSEGFEAETEFLIKAAAAGFSFDAIPIATIYAGEKSNMKHVRTTMNFIKVLLKQY